MIVAPLWAFLILFAIGGAVKLIFGPRWKRQADERRRLFAERNMKPGERDPGL